MADCHADFFGNLQCDFLHFGQIAIIADLDGDAGKVGLAGPAVVDDGGRSDGAVRHDDRKLAAGLENCGPPGNIDNCSFFAGGEFDKVSRSNLTGGQDLNACEKVGQRGLNRQSYGDAPDAHSGENRRDGDSRSMKDHRKGDGPQDNGCAIFQDAGSLSPIVARFGGLIDEVIDDADAKREKAEGDQNLKYGAAVGLPGIRQWQAIQEKAEQGVGEDQIDKLDDAAEHSIRDRRVFLFQSMDKVKESKPKNKNAAQTEEKRYPVDMDIFKYLEHG